jgi:hypothetical protein
MVLAPFNAIILSLAIYAEFELYFDLACRVRRPGFQFTSIDSHSAFQNTHPNFPLLFNINNFAFAETPPTSNPCPLDPVIRITVAKLLTSICIQLHIL